MERHHSSRSIAVSSPPASASASASTSSQHKVTSVLGLYGLPGSGKSTLCKCLVDHFRPFFGSNKTLYLAFPPNPSQAEVVNKLKELCLLTNFRSRVNLGNNLELENVVSLLRSCHISSSRVFLVVDNISDESWEAVNKILHLGFGHGSKIILVAHTLDALSVTLDSCKRLLHWASDSLAVPSMNEMEASELLLHATRGSCAALDKHTLFESLTSRKKETVKRIVHMCSCKHGREWLPLVLKAVGARLLRYEKRDVEAWETDLENFWTRVKTYEQIVVIEELLGENFKALPDEHLRLAFLDVALFILRFEANIAAVCNALSMMHGFTATRITMMIQDLQRRCFLTVSGFGIVEVHDVYLKFAKSIQECGPSKYIIASLIRWRWEECQIGDAESGRSFVLKEHQGLGDEGKLRALVLEVGESCERVDLQGFSCLKAVCVRNCKSLVVLGLAGLSSFTFLEIRNCASFGRVECNDSDYTSLQNVKSLSIRSNLCSVVLEQVDQERTVRPSSYFWQPAIVANVVKRFIVPLIRQPQSLEVGLIAGQMRSLQILNLENTGMRRLECVGGMWPQLRALTVIEQHLERLELGCLPKLENFQFRDVGELMQKNASAAGCNIWSRTIYLLPNRSSKIWRRKERDERYLLPGKDLMLGCPQLKRATVQSSFLKQGQLGSLPAGLVTLKLHYLHTATELPDLSSAAHTLQDLHILDCEKLQRVNLADSTGYYFKSLRTLKLRLCDDLVEVNGIESLSSLRVLKVAHCRKLESLKGFENLEMLQKLSLRGLGELREISDFSSLGELRVLVIGHCPKVSTVAKSTAGDHQYLCEMGKLRTECWVTVADYVCAGKGSKLTKCEVSIVDAGGKCSFDLSKCKELQEFVMYYYGIISTAASCSISTRPAANGEVNIKVEGLDKLENLRHLSIDVVGDHEDRNVGIKDDIIRAKCIAFASLVRIGLGKGCFSFELSSVARLGKPGPISLSCLTQRPYTLSSPILP